MRADMFKVIVERPRTNRSWPDNGRIWRNSKDRGSKIGMKKGYSQTKHLNENLAPLKRWLHKQIHRPWSAVYSELSQSIDRRSTVQAHIYEHIDDFVEHEVQMRDGVVCIFQEWPRSEAGWIPIRQSSRIKLFVHPVTGILLPNRGLHEARRKLKEKNKLEREQRCQEWQQQREQSKMLEAKAHAEREEKYRPVRKKLAESL